MDGEDPRIHQSTSVLTICTNALLLKNGCDGFQNMVTGHAWFLELYIHYEIPVRMVKQQLLVLK